MKLKDIRESVEIISGLDLSDKSRETQYIIARCIYFEIAKKYTIMSLKDIGKEVGRNHASVINSLNRTSERLMYESNYNQLKNKVLIQIGIISNKYEDIEKLKEENKELRKLLARDDDFISKIRFLTDAQYEVFKQRAEIMLKFVTK